MLLHGHFSALLKGIGEVNTFVEVAASVLVGVRAVRLLVELWAVLKNIGPVFRGFTTGNVTVKRGETSVNLRMRKLVFSDKIYMGMKRFAFIALFVTHTPIDERG